MGIFEIAQKVATLLKGRTIYFDFKSYDNEEDIPHIYDGQTRCNVEFVRFNEDGSLMEIHTQSYSCGINLENSADIEWFENNGTATYLYDLIMNTYYETEESLELGDFESDFLGIPWWDLSK